ncbi:MAG: hypothetical protein ACOYLS_15160 [Polymorphobacter sp.]
MRLYQLQMLRGGSIWTWVVGFTLVIAGFAAGWIAAQQTTVVVSREDGIATTNSKLFSKRNELAGRRVKLRGRLSECFGWECALCPEAGEFGPCLQLSFRPLLPGTGFGSTEQEALFRFASVVMTATFDPTCLDDAACLDRQVMLRDAEVIEVTRRRASAEGFWRQATTTKLLPYNGSMATQMLRAFHQAGGPILDQTRIFTTGSRNPRYVVCTSNWTDDRDPGNWPVFLEAALHASSSADWFHCREVRQIDGAFVAQVAE